MKNRNSIGALLALLLLAFSSSPLRAQGGVDEFFTNAINAMNQAKQLGMPAGAEKWNEALGHLTEATTAFDKRAPELFGPKFGVFWYNKGFCELRLGKFDDAAKSFETCHTKYANKPGATSNNSFEKKALLKWGEAAQGIQQWEVAIDKYKKFLAERGPNDSFPLGAFYINLSVCNFKAGKIASGVENLQIAIKNKQKFPTPPAGIIAGFQAFCEAAIEKKDEASMLDFLKQNRHHVTFQPWESQPYSPVFMTLAAKAMQAELKHIAFELYSLVPSSVTSESSLIAAIDRLANYSSSVPDGTSMYNASALKKQLDESRARTEEGLLPEVTALAAMAYIHEQNGNVRGAYAAYEHLERFHSDIPKEKRENHLYQLVRTSSILGHILETEKEGQKFLRLFPGSENEENVRSLMLTGLFYNGEYDLCLEVASNMEPDLAKHSKGSKQHDICLHVLGGSYFYTGQFSKAREYLKRHPVEYPESQFKVAAQYFEAANFAQLQAWKTAAELLDKFLTKFPNPKDNSYLPFALFDRANCHYILEEYDEAVERLDRIEKEFPEATNREMVFNLKGNIHQTNGENEEALEYYTKALNLAESKRNAGVAGEALFYLVASLGEEKKGEGQKENYTKALTFYDKFWASYGADSPYQAQVAVAGLPAMEDAGRSEEGLERLQGVISKIAKQPGAYGLEESINSFTKFYLKSHSEEELKTLYYRFPGIDREDKAAQALLRIALIGIFEKKVQTATKAGEDDQASKAKATIQVLFSDLKNDFELKTLSSFILVSVGDYLREKTASPREAIPYYEESLGREDKTHNVNAQFGLADIYGRSSAGGDLAKAAKSLTSIYETSKAKKQKERALYRLVEVLAKMEQWEDVKTRAKEFLDVKKNYNEFAPYVSYTLGQAYENSKEIENALATYGGASATYRGLIVVSAPAQKRYMELLWSRGRAATEKSPSDKQLAYSLGYDYIKQTTNIRQNPKVPENEKDLWDEVAKLVKTYSANSAVTPIQEDEQ